MQDEEYVSVFVVVLRVITVSVASMSTFSPNATMNTGLLQTLQ